MLCAYADHIDPDDPLNALRVGELEPDPAEPGWVRVQVRAASLNHHDLWTLRGVGISAEAMPMILGCDAAGVTDDGRPVIVHSVIGDPAAGHGDETLDPRRSLLSEVYPGTLAEYVHVPARNVLDKPDALTFAEAACLPTAWLTAFRMLTTRGNCQPGERVLVQGAGGGVATACIQLGHHLGLHVIATSRDAAKLEAAAALGADEVYPTGTRLPAKVDAVMETVGRATWEHSLRSLRPGGRVVISGATSGPNPPADLARVFFLQLSVIGSTMGTRDELQSLIDLCVSSGLRPPIAGTYSLADAPAAFARLAAGDVVGKLIIEP